MRFIRSLSLQNDAMGNCIIHGLEKETEDWENIYVWMDFHTGVCYKEKTKVKNKRREKDEDRRIKVKMDNLRFWAASLGNLEVGSSCPCAKRMETFNTP